MKRAILIAAALFTAIFMVSCGDKDKGATPDNYPEYISRDGVKKPITGAAFYYAQDAGYKIYLTTDNIAGKEIYETIEWIAIDMPVEFLGTELDMATDDLEGERWILYIEYHEGFFMDDYVGPDEARAGTIKVTKGEGNYFEVELTDFELHDGTLLSCRAARAIDTEYDGYYEGENYFEGETNFSYGGRTFTSAYINVIYYYGQAYEDYYNTDIYVGGYNDAGEECSFYFKVNTSAKFLSSGTYSLSENIGDKTFTINSDFYCEMYDEEDVLFVRKYHLTAGSFDLEISDYYCKLTLNGDLTVEDPEITVPAATFVFDYRDDYTRGGGVLRHPAPARKASLNPRSNAAAAKR